MFTYGCEPHPGLGWRTSAEKLYGRHPRCLLSLCLPSKTIEQEPGVAITNKNSHSRSSKFSVGDLVFARNYATGSKWLLAKMISNLGNVLCSVRTDRGI